MPGIVPITGGGVFSRTNIAQINSNFAALGNPDLWIRPQYGNNNNPGTYESPLATAAGASQYLRPGMVVGVLGVLTEEYSSPMVNDITFRGMGTLPRQATTSGTPNGGGSTWLSPSGGTGALFQPNGQGWVIQNIFFNNSATAAPCIKLVNAGDPPTSNCSEKTSIIDCILTGTDDGISALDLPNNVYIARNRFFGFSGSGDIAISSATGAGTGTLQGWVIEDNDFEGNASHIVAPLTSAILRRNHFSYIYGSVTTTVQLNLTGGSNNALYGNAYDVPHTTTGLGSMFTLGTNDRMYGELFATAVATTIFGFGTPVTP